jgi:hypothetical protein
MLCCFAVCVCCVVCVCCARVVYVGSAVRLASGWPYDLAYTVSDAEPCTLSPIVLCSTPLQTQVEWWGAQCTRTCCSRRSAHWVRLGLVRWVLFWKPWLQLPWMAQSPHSSTQR